MTRFIRPTAEELKEMKVVVLHGTSERKDICVAGWVEDVPHLDASEAIVLHEPVHFTHTSARNPAKGSYSVDTSVVMPIRGLPLTMEFFEYTKVEMFEMGTHFGAFYVSAVGELRRSHVSFVPSIALPVPQPQQQGTR